MKIFFISLLLCLGAYRGYSEIFECQKLADTLCLIQEEDVVFMEIDEILFSSKHKIASIAFLNYLKQQLLKEKNNIDETLSAWNDCWLKILLKAHFFPKEPNINMIFDQLRSKNVILYGLTSRPLASQGATIKLLMQHHLYFDTITRPIDLKNFFVTQGVIFSKNQDRYEIVESFFSRTFSVGKRAVFIDYDLRNLIYMQQHFEEKGLPFLGIYFHIEECDNNSVQIAELQLEYIDKLLPDSYAKILSK